MDLNQINRDSDPHNVQYLLSVLRETTEVQANANDVSDHHQRIESSYPQAGPSSSSLVSVSRNAAQGGSVVRGVDPRVRKVLPPPPPKQSSSHATEEVEVDCVLPMSPPRSSLQQEGSTTMPHAPQQPILKPSPSSSSSTVHTPPDPTNLSHLPASQALPHLQNLVSSALFLRALMTLKREQDELERTLHREWNGMMQSSTPSQTKEPEREREWERWKVKALRRWDLVQQKQQIRLMELKTPGFYPTKSPSARANQRKILDLLSGLIEGG